jgi:hypothetical protein
MIIDRSECWEIIQHIGRPRHTRYHQVHLTLLSCSEPIPTKHELSVNGRDSDAYPCGTSRCSTFNITMLFTLTLRQNASDACAPTVAASSPVSPSATSSGNCPHKAYFKTVATAASQPRVRWGNNKTQARKEYPVLPLRILLMYCIIASHIHGHRLYNV